MANLHLLRSSGFTHMKLQQCQTALLEDDLVLLIDDGVYNLKHPIVEQLASKHQVYALTDHVSARGIVAPLPNVTLCDYEQFVSLTLAADKVITWQ
ncbi:sulfurtransferase complex subunit TusB [Thalassotalea mangrovi]|uniref:Sulfurtransferase complex subunit TusB n=1 Tax=Thalassotalea mangrovi TaxID=2572245 RepID=A0A4U1B3Y7_9GAMM|nr:sulfurtransferase complex subunit TusB [Thalassotalea mangrovi]TKB44825.1 sulfurtransferase complex subunit TusB [Thalassotalea mangrovi]